MREPAARSLEYWARTCAAEPALHADGFTLTFQEWNDYANQLAGSLADRGIGPGEVVALRARTRIEWVVVALAVAKIDATLLPMQPDLAPKAMRRVLIDAGAVAFICDDHDPGSLYTALGGLPLKLRAALNGPAPGFFNFWNLFPAVAPPRFTRSHPAVLHYSIPENGRLRAVAVPQKRVAAASRSRTPVADPGASLITLTLNHAYGAQQLWQALAAGRRIVLLPSADPLPVLRAIARHRITEWMDFAPAFEAMARLHLRTIQRFNLSSLQTVSVGGGGAPHDLRTRLVRLFGPIVTQTYGVPETGLIARLPADHADTRPGSCGRPCEGALVQIRDGSGSTLPPNAVGEIWARTAASIERRVIGEDDVAALRDADDFVRTGHTGRLDEDGFLFVTGEAAERQVTQRRAFQA